MLLKRLFTAVLIISAFLVNAQIEEEQLDNNHPRGIILAVYDKQLNTIDNWH